MNAIANRMSDSLAPGPRKTTRIIRPGLAPSQKSDEYRLWKPSSNRSKSAVWGEFSWITGTRARNFSNAVCVSPSNLLSHFCRSFPVSGREIKLAKCFTATWAWERQDWIRAISLPAPRKTLVNIAANQQVNVIARYVKRYFDCAIDPFLITPKMETILHWLIMRPGVTYTIACGGAVSSSNHSIAYWCRGFFLWQLTDQWRRDVGRILLFVIFTYWIL